MLIGLSLLVLSTILVNSLWDWIAVLFFTLAAWYSYQASLAPMDFYYIVFLIASFLIVISVLLGAYIAYEDRKANRKYRGELMNDSEMSEGLARNDALLEFHRSSMRHYPVKRKRFNPLKWAKY